MILDIDTRLAALHTFLLSFESMIPGQLLLQLVTAAFACHAASTLALSLSITSGTFCMANPLSGIWVAVCSQNGFHSPLSTQLQSAWQTAVAVA